MSPQPASADPPPQPTPAADPPPQPTLTDGVVTLRPWRDVDIDAARLQQRAAVERWRQAYQSGRQTVAFLVEYGGHAAGAVEVRQLGDAVGELSWAVFPDHRGRQVATRAVGMLVDFCFADLGLARVVARVEPDNIASLRTAGRAGLRREGLMRRAETTGGVRRDQVLLARLADDPPPSLREGFTGVLNAGLPTKRVITQGLIRSTTGKVLLCELTYKRDWDLPGGVVDLNESPAQGLRREIGEELGVELVNSGLLLVNWLTPWRGWDDACQFVFDLGQHDEALVTRMVLQPRELVAVHWCSLAEADEHIAPYQKAILTRLMSGVGPTAYLEAGQEAGLEPI